MSTHTQQLSHPRPLSQTRACLHMILMSHRVSKLLRAMTQTTSETKFSLNASSAYLLRIVSTNMLLIFYQIDALSLALLRTQMLITRCTLVDTAIQITLP